MILRSLTRHVRDQNCFAVGLNLCIVLVGDMLAYCLTRFGCRRMMMTLRRMRCIGR